MKLILNGQEFTAPVALTISELIVQKELSGKPIAIEHNGTALLPQDFPTTLIQDGDQIELIVIAAGG